MQLWETVNTILLMSLSLSYWCTPTFKGFFFPQCLKGLQRSVAFQSFTTSTEAGATTRDSVCLKVVFNSDCWFHVVVGRLLASWCVHAVVIILCCFSMTGIIEDNWDMCAFVLIAFYIICMQILLPLEMIIFTAFQPKPFFFLLALKSSARCLKLFYWEVFCRISHSFTVHLNTSTVFSITKLYKPQLYLFVCI